MPKAIDVSQLSKVGVQVATSADKITDVHVPFTPKEWWDVASERGRHYIGGCCGNTSAMQDIVCGTFRDSGHMSSGRLLRLGDLARQHEGFELWAKKMSYATFGRHVEGWKKLDPWDKIGLIYLATRDKLADSDTGGTRPNLTTSRRVNATFETLSNGLAVLKYTDLFDSFDHTGEPPEFEPQRHANRLMLVSRIIPAARVIVDVLTKNDKPFEGVTITHEDKPDEPVSNGMGLCIYADRAPADDMIARWVKDDAKLAGKLRVRPVRVTMESGLTFLDNPSV